MDEAYSPLKGVAQTEEDGSELPSSPEPEELTEQRVVVRYREVKYATNFLSFQVLRYLKIW